MQTTNRTITTAGLALALIAGLAGLTPAAATDTTSPEYLAVIDAGSSGTRLTLYSDDATTLVPREVTKARTNTRGLSSFASEPAQAGPAAVTPLLDQLDAYLAERGIATEDVPVALLATAGMRNVRQEDRATAQAIMTSAGGAIAASGHPVADNRILPAAQEATLAWLDSNVLAGTLNRTKGSIGIVEVGGASAQVAFRSPVTNGRAVRQVSVEGRIIPVVAVSYLGLGGNDARSRMQADNDAGSFCFPTNDGGQEPLVYVASSARPVNASTARFSWQRCGDAYGLTISAVGSQRSPAAAVPPSMLRDLPGFDSASFVGLGSLPFTYSDLGVTEASNERTALRGASEATCSGSGAWTKVLALYAGRPSTFADTLCSTAAYSYQFLFGALGVGVSPQRFTTDDAAFPRSPAWPSGYAITVLDP